MPRAPHSHSHWLKPKKPENIVGTDEHGNVYMEDMTTQYGVCPAVLTTPPPLTVEASRGGWFKMPPVDHLLQS
jgi:hypothetical protein